MELIADRFILDDDETALDLATGERVALTVAPAGSEREQQRWVLACDVAQRRHHPANRAPLGLRHRGEARGDSRRARSWPARRPAPTRRPRPSSSSRGPPPRRSARSSSIRHGIRPRSMTLWGPDGAGKGTIVGHLARAARLHGFVPVAAPLLTAYAQVLRGRSLLVIDVGDRRAGRSAWLAASMTVSRPHVLLLVAREEPSTAEGVAVGPVSIDALVRAVRPEVVDGPRAAAIRRFAERSYGWPGRFARLVWDQPVSTASRKPSHSTHWIVSGRRRAAESLRAAEQPSVYGVGERCPAAETRPAEKPPAPGDVALWRGRIESGQRLLAEGRHARGERMLRQAIGAMARRREWAAAARGSLALARLLIHRGRPQEARSLLTAASSYCGEVGDELALNDAAVLSATASIELARLDPAETAASAAASAARAFGDAARADRALAVLSRTLFWRARYDEADGTLKSMARSHGDATDAMVVNGLEVAIAVGRGDLGLAVSRAAEALVEAQRVADARLVASAARSAAFAHLAVFDLAAVEREVAVSIAAARACHDPLTAARSRLILAEALRRAGKTSAAARALRRVIRLGATQLPPIVRARCDLIRDLLAPPGGRATCSSGTCRQLACPRWPCTARHPRPRRSRRRTIQWWLRSWRFSTCVRRPTTSGRC